MVTGAATEEFNRLEAEFEAAGSEIETVAREEIAEDFAFVASAYGFATRTSRRSSPPGSGEELHPRRGRPDGGGRSRSTTTAS